VLAQEVVYKPISDQELETNFPRLGDLTRQMKALGLDIIWVLPGQEMGAWSEPGPGPGAESLPNM